MPDQDSEPIPPKETDLRYFPRWEVKNRVLYRIEKDNDLHEGTTKDISCAGACIIGDAKVALHQKIKLTVQLSEGTTIRLNGRILWVKSDIDQPEMGVSFYNTTDEIQDSILHHAFELDKERVLKQWYKGWNDS